MQKAPSALIFDLDDTLIPSSRFYVSAVVHALNQKSNLMAVYEEARRQVKADLPSLHTSARNRLLYFKRFLELLNDRASSAIELCNLYENELSRLIREWSQSERRMELIRALQARYPTFILTNETTRAQLLKIEALCHKQPHGFDGIICSEEVGYEKPDQQIFRKLFERYNLSPEHCLFIGDSVKNDVLAAVELGLPVIQTIEFVSETGSPGHIRIIKHLTELLEILS